MFLSIWEGYREIDMPQDEEVPEDIGEVDTQSVGIYDHTLHVVINSPKIVIDDSNDGEELVLLDGKSCLYKRCSKLG